MFTLRMFKYCTPHKSKIAKTDKKTELHSILLELRLEVDFLLEKYPLSKHKLSFLDKQINLYGNDMSVLHRIAHYAPQIKNMSKVLSEIKSELIAVYERKTIEQEIDFFKSESLYDIDYTLLQLNKELSKNFKG